MKKIIKGKKYDTDTATYIARYTHSNRSDFGYYEEDLYRKRTGEYFLYGEGGPASKYAGPAGLNSWIGGTRIMPLTYKDALAWGEKHMTAEEFESEFGEIKETGEKRMVAISITATAHDSLKRAAQDRGISVSALIEEYAYRIKK